MPEYSDVDPEIVARLALVCLGLPETYQEPAWVGMRWRIRKRTIAHVVTIDDGYPPAYSRAFEVEGPLTVVTFRSSGEELEALTHAGHPFFRPQWAPNVVGMVLDDDTDWDEVTELLTESYCVMAPKKLAAQVDRPE